MSVGFHLHDTIAGLASPPGSAIRGIIRISGPDTRVAVSACFEPQDRGRWQSTRVAERHPGTLTLRSTSRSPLAPEGGEGPGARGDRLLASTTVPAPCHSAPSPQPFPTSGEGATPLRLSADVHLWPTRRSYTGEPVAEIHTIGSPPLLEAILSELVANDVRPARPGEFTLRAFLSGRLDLLQAEAVLGVIDAHDQFELQSALSQLGGGVSTEIVRLRNDMLDLLADLEAGLDFADEHVEFVPHADLVRRVQAGRNAVTALLERAVSRLTSRPRSRVVLAGPPNAGKSTLFNALVGRSAALVSPIAGTTRDYLVADCDCGGVSITLIDTAGCDSADTGIAGKAQRQRRDQLAQADLVVWCIPADVDSRVIEFDDSVTAPVLSVQTKSDLFPPLSPPGRAVGGEGSVGHPNRPSPPTPLLQWERGDVADALQVSALTGQGLSELVTAIAARLSQPSGRGQMQGTTAARCRDSLTGACAAFDRAVEIARHEIDQSLLALEIRDALDELGKVVGAVYTDDLLDRIFSKFCIGK